LEIESIKEYFLKNKDSILGTIYDNFFEDVLKIETPFSYGSIISSL